MKLMRDCARQALKTYEDRVKEIEEKKSRGVKLRAFEGSVPWRDFCKEIEETLVVCYRDSDYTSVGLAYLDYKQSRSAANRAIGESGFNIDSLLNTFKKKKELKKIIKGLVGGNRTIRI